LQTEVTIKGAKKNPIGEKNSRFHTGTRFIRTKEIRRASEQTSPQVARAVGLPVRDERGGLSSGSSSIRRFRFKAPKGAH